MAGSGLHRLINQEAEETPMDNRRIRIRESEKRSHTAIYAREELYGGNGWLRKPIRTVQDILPFFDAYRELRVLDLGCGIGRNSICIAERYQDINCRVDCVDLLEIAIEKLRQNAEKHHVSKNIHGILRSIEEFDICAGSYDLILAVSALEHVDSEESFVRKLYEIKNGLKENGIVCLVINAEVRESNAETDKVLEAQFEVNLPAAEILSVLENVFSGWKVLKNSVQAQEYMVPRDTAVSRLCTKAVTYVARK